MVYFVLYNLCSESCDCFSHFLPSNIEPLHLDSMWSLDIALETRKAQTSLFIDCCFCRFFCNNGIYHDYERVRLIFSIFCETNHDNTLIDAYLRSCETYGSIFRIFYIGEHSFRQDTIFVEFWDFDRC